MRNFTIIVIGVATIYVGKTAGWANAWWFVIACGIMLAVVFSVIDIVCKLWLWLERKHEIHLRVYDQEEEIVDAEVIEERDTKWWRV